MASPAFTGIATLGGETLATTNQIPSLTAYASLASPAFTGPATLGSKYIATTDIVMGYATMNWVTTNLVYCAPLYNHSFMGTPKIGTKIIATVDQIPNLAPYALNADVIETLSSYATLNSPAFTGQVTVGGCPVVMQTIIVHQPFIVCTWGIILNWMFKLLTK